MSNIARSTVIASGFLELAGQHLVQTCPPGHTLLVKSVGLQFWGDYPANTRVYIQAKGGGAPVTLLTFGSQTEDHVMLSTWFVLNNEAQLIVDSDVANVWIWISGADLLGESIMPQVLPQ